MSDRDEGSEHAPLTEKERRFVEAFVGEAQGNITRAAEIAGYNSKDREVLRQRGKANLKKPKIKAAIAQLNEIIEALSTMTVAQRKTAIRGYVRDGVALPGHLLASIPPLAEELEADEATAREEAASIADMPQDGPKTAAARGKRARSIASALELRQFWTDTLRNTEAPWHARLQASAMAARAYGLFVDREESPVNVAITAGSNDESSGVRVYVNMPTNGRGPSLPSGPVVEADAVEVTDRKAEPKKR